jgi:AIPR protein
VSKVHVSQLRAYLDKTFKPFIDLSDCANAPDADRAHLFSTRALAAWTLCVLDGSEPEQAAKCVTDGTHDNGIDCIYYNKRSQTLRIIQTKWRANGQGSIEVGDIHKFIAGVNDILDLNNTRFDDRFLRHWHQIENAIQDAQTKIDMILACTGRNELSPEAEGIISDFKKKINDVHEIVSFEHLTLSKLHAALRNNFQGKSFDPEVHLFDWGVTKEPYVSYYGQINGSDLAQWYKGHHQRLLSPNLRVFLGITESNAGIIETALQHPDHFWYLNNGVTAICDAIKKTPAGGSSRAFGNFSCTNLQVVNGAQTIGSLADAYDNNPDAVANTRVLMRIISLQGSPATFSVDITKGTNTQNRIGARDFAALDQEQARIATELALDGIVYAFKSGEDRPSQEAGFDFGEATMALACAHQNPRFCVQAVSDIEDLWQANNYPALFNGSLSGKKLWRLVRVKRHIDKQVGAPVSNGDKVEAGVRQFGGAALAHLVFNELDLSNFDDPDFDFETVLSDVPTLTFVMIQHATAVIKETFPGERPTFVFSHRKRQLRLIEEADRRKRELGAILGRGRARGV